MILALPYPAIDPVAVEIGPIAIRWYSLAYIGGLVLGWRYCRALVARSPSSLTGVTFDDFLLWATLGVVLGGRLGYVIFYKPAFYLEHPLQALYLWQGGMSYHGGLIGMILAMIAFSWRRGFTFFEISDIVGAATPIGLFLGRIANFINAELYGRPSDVPWAMVFPGGGPLPRHPSQLYEAALEGVVLFLGLYVLVRLGALTRPGVVSGAYLVGYGAARSFAELFREPDEHLGFLFAGATMGQLLSIPMILAGVIMIVWALRRQPLARAP